MDNQITPPGHECIRKSVHTQQRRGLYRHHSVSACGNPEKICTTMLWYGLFNYVYAYSKETTSAHLLISRSHRSGVDAGVRRWQSRPYSTPFVWDRWLGQTLSIPRHGQRRKQTVSVGASRFGSNRRAPTGCTQSSAPWLPRRGASAQGLCLRGCALTDAGGQRDPSVLDTGRSMPQGRAHAGSGGVRRFAGAR